MDVKLETVINDCSHVWLIGFDLVFITTLLFVTMNYITILIIIMIV